MMRSNYDPQLAAGSICAAGTLGQIIPPSIVLVLLGDVISNAYQQAQLKMGIFSPETVSVGELFVGALIPGLVLVLAYLAYLAAVAIAQPTRMPSMPDAHRPPLGRLLGALLPPLLLIIAVLGSIMKGVATPTEAAAVGAIGALLLALFQRRLSLLRLQEVMRSTLQVTSMVFLILIGAAVFSLVFRGFGGDDAVHQILTDLPLHHHSIYRARPRGRLARAGYLVTSSGLSLRTYSRESKARFADFGHSPDNRTVRPVQSHTRYLVG